MPWYYDESGAIRDSDQDDDIITVLDENVSEDDGLKLAAAPEMLDALIGCIEAMQNPGLDDGSVLAEAERVARKAMGGE